MILAATQCFLRPTGALSQRVGDAFLSSIKNPNNRFKCTWGGRFEEIDRRLVQALKARGPPLNDLLDVGVSSGATTLPGIEDQLTDKAKALGVGDRVRLTGFRYPSAPLMAGCDIHAMPAVNEPFGRSLIEAMLLCNADDPAAMAEAIIGLLDSPEQSARIAATALEAAMERCGAEQHVKQTSAIYQSLLAGAARRAW